MLQLVEKLRRETSHAACWAEFEFVVALHKAVVDKGNGQSQQHNATHNAHATQHASRNGDGVHVSIADGRHGDNNPPTGCRDAGVVLIASLQVKAVL